MRQKIIGILLCWLMIGVSTISVFANTSVNEATDTLLFELFFSAPTIEKVMINGDVFDQVTLDDLPVIENFQNPCLPMKSLKILLPQGTTVQAIHIITDEKTRVGDGYHLQVGGRVIPLQEQSSGVAQICSLTKVSSEITGELYPKCLYSIVGVYRYRGYVILQVNVYPVQYNLKTGELVLFPHLRLFVDTIASPQDTALRDFPSDAQLVADIVDNPSMIETYTRKEVRQSAVTDSYEYVIITNSKLKNADAGYSFQDLIDFKNAQGVSATIVTVEEIMLNPDYQVTGKWGDANSENPFFNSTITGSMDIFNDKPARVRNFIRYAYSEWGTRYVLLGGDADVAKQSDNIIPLRGLFANESGLPLNPYAEEEQDDIPSDVYYACLDGNFNYDCDLHFGESPDRNNVVEVDEADLYAEVWVGRCCADSAEEVSNFVSKTLQYAQTTDDSYLSEIMFAGEDLGSQFYFQYGGDYKDQNEYLVPPSFNLSKLYDNEEFDWWIGDFIDLVYRVHPQIINHDGHGYPNYMLKAGSDSFYAFENEYPFFIYSHSCLTGSFDNYYPGGRYSEEDCIAEILTCEIPYGAYACILNARYGLGSETSPSSPSGSLDESFYKALFTQNIRELGAANHFSKEDNVWRINANGYRWCYYETNLFGDPQLRIKSPHELPPNKPTIPSGPSSGKAGVECTYSTSTTDPNNYELYYLFDWGDGTFSDWLGPYPTGVICEAKYTWTESGSYLIKVKAKNSYDIESVWSDPLPITMPYSLIKQTDQLSDFLFKRFLDTFLLLRQLL